MKKYLLLILFLSIILRFYGLGFNPPSLDWDEASLGYNAYSILINGKDEYGQKLPVNLKSFGDYKPALYVYITIPSVSLFGLQEYAVRIPSAILGVMSVLFAYFLVKELFRGDKYSSQYAFLTALFLAISPWHLQFSRVGFEANAGLFWFMAGTWAFLVGLRKRSFFLYSSVAYALSLYSYHSVRLLTPLFVLMIVLYARKILIKEFRGVGLACVIGAIVLIPLGLSFIRPESKARFEAVVQFGKTTDIQKLAERVLLDKERGYLIGSITHNRRIQYVPSFLSSYLDHLNPSFLFIHGDQYIRHGPIGMGILYYWDFLFIIVGIIAVIRKREALRFIVFAWFLVAPVASALTIGTPHAVRSILYLPIYQIFISAGIVAVVMRLKNKRYFLVILGMITLTFTAQLFYYFDLYYVHTPVETSQNWQYGYKQLVAEVKNRQDKFDHILITNSYDQPYIYFLFYTPVDPIWYQQHGSKEASQGFRSFGKYEFRPILWEQDKESTHTLIVTSPRELVEQNFNDQPSEVIRFLDGTVAFLLFER